MSAEPMSEERLQDIEMMAHYADVQPISYRVVMELVEEVRRQRTAEPQMRPLSSAERSAITTALYARRDKVVDLARRAREENWGTYESHRKSRGAKVDICNWLLANVRELRLPWDS